MRTTLYLLLILVGVNATYGQTKKYLTQLEGGILTYGVATKELGYSFRGISSYHVTPSTYVGIGSGYEQYMFNEVDDKTFKLIPIFIQAKYILKPEKRTSLFGAFDLGYGVNLNKKEVSNLTKTSYEGGVLASPQLGIHWKSKRNKEYFSLAIGYKYQVLKEDNYYNYRWTEDSPVLWNADNSILQGYDIYSYDKYHMHRLSVMLGFGF
jgi:hypothetical protein